MNAANWIALYAAIVGTAALAWQGVTYLTERRPKVRINLRLLHIRMTKEDQEKAGTDIIDYPWWLMIEIVNFGKSPVRISNVVIETTSNEKTLSKWSLKRWNLPWLLESSEKKDVSITNADAGTLIRGQELCAVVTTMTGVKFYSKRLRVLGGPGSPEALMISPEHHAEIFKTMPGSGQPDRQELRLFGFDDELRDLGIGDDD